MRLQRIMGLALLLWFNALGLQLSWATAVFAHLVWIVPVVTLVISIQVYSFDPALEEAAYDLGAHSFIRKQCAFEDICNLSKVFGEIRRAESPQYDSPG